MVSQGEAGLAAGNPASVSPVLPTSLPSNRMIIRTATLSVIVDDAADVLQKISAATEKAGGYVADTKQWREQDQIRATVTLRVPATHLNSVLAQIRAASIRVENESLSGEDVSEQYSDLSAQLLNLEAAERELRELLRTVRQRTQKAADILEIYNELARVRGNIEQIKGRMKYLEQVTALSTITVQLTPDVLARPVVQPGWRAFAVLKEASRALVETLKVIASAVIWLTVYLLPLALMFVAFALLVRLVWRYLRHHVPRDDVAG